MNITNKAGRENLAHNRLKEDQEGPNGVECGA